MLLEFISSSLKQNYDGRHPAWVRWCPVAVKARAQQQQQQQQPLPKLRHVAFQGARTLEETDDGFQEGKRKRLRSRPEFLNVNEEIAKRLRQGKLIFATRVKTDLAGAQGESTTNPEVATLGAAATLEAANQDVGMQGAD
ncbi:hypothetical protein P885DRAFT_72614 [Corynascus similis CBS 632.67]